MNLLDIQPIRTEADYTASLAAVADLVDADPALGTQEGDVLDILTILIERYEAELFPHEALAPFDATKSSPENVR